METTDAPDVAAALEWVTRITGPVTGVQELTGGWTSTMLALTAGSGEVVLRLMTREPWRAHGEALTTREHQVQTMLAGTPVPAPGSLALDASGGSCGHPAHLMTRLPGSVDVDRVDPVSLGRLADLLVSIHEVEPTIEIRPFQSWAWEAKFLAPSWSSDPGLWDEAFAVLRTPPPGFEPRLIHRDFQHRNVLWTAGRVSGVVDWVETSIGPAWLDVAHCSTNIALAHSTEAADRFAAAYLARTDCEAQPYFDVMDVVGFLPPPGKRSYFSGDGPEHGRLERRLRSVLEGLR